MSNPLSDADVGRARVFFESSRTRGHLLFALAWVALADGLFYNREVGWTLGAYGALTGLAVVLLGESRFRTPPAVLLGGSFFCLCVRAMVEPEPLVVFLGVVSCAAFTLTLRGGWSWSLACWVRRGLLFAGGLLASLALSIGVLALLPLAPLLALAKVRRLRAWLIPALFGLVFLGLFALANPVIALALKSFREALGWLGERLPVFVSLPRMLFWVTVGAWLWTLLRHAPRPAEDSAGPLASGCVPDCAELQAKGVVRNALVVFNALFALQTASDLWYLWGGGALPQGMTYAQYAHRGAYPLVATALLAAAFVLAAFREESPASARRAERLLVYAWLAQNLFLVVSAAWRLWLYVGVYSLSRLRLAAGVWMLLVACGLVWILVRIFSRRSNLWLIRANALTALAVVLVYGCSLRSMFIADFNVRHCREAGVARARPVDLRYLNDLGYDALPALVRLERQVRGTPLEKAVRAQIGQLSYALDLRVGNWRGVTVKRAFLRRYLEREYRPERGDVEAAAPSRRESGGKRERSP